MNTKTNNWVHIIKSKNNNSRKSSNRFKKDHGKNGDSAPTEIDRFKNPETFKKNLWKKWRFRN